MSLIDADGQGTFKFALGGRPEEEYVMATPAEPMRFTEDIYITGKLSGDDLARLAPTYGSWIYLATDEEGDSALPGGFQALSAYPQLHATHAPLNMKNLTLAQADAAVAAVEAGPRPTLVQCMSGGRAGAVALMYEAKKQHWTVEQAMTYAQENKLMFVKNAAVVDLVTAYVAKCQSRPPVLFRQLYELETSTYTYLLADPQSKEAILIDPVDVTVDRDLQFVQELGLTLTLAVNTHCHADHVTGTGLLKQKCPGVRSVIAATSGAKADMHVKDGDLIRYAVECRATPGHTAGCMSYVMDDRSMCFTGDALFVRGCGRTDFQQGSASQLYESIMTKLYTLPGETLVYPGHDYKGRTVSTIEEEKRWNPRLTKGLEGFVHIMDNLNLAYPKKIDEALPKNLQDGITLPTEPQA